MKRLLTILLFSCTSVLYGQIDTVYFPSLKGMGEYKGKDKEGYWKFFYLNNQKQSEGLYKNNVPEGHWINWYRNGIKYVEGIYENGNQEGEWKTWDSLGRIVREETFVKNIRNDKITEWNYEKDEMVVSSFKDGVIHGLTEYWSIETKK